MQSDLETLKQYMPDYLQSRGVDIQKASRNNTVCPVCKNGSKTGCFHYYPDTQKVKCFSCNFNGDLFDLIAQEKSIDNSAAIQQARKMYGTKEISTKSSGNTFTRNYTSHPTDKKKKQPQEDYSFFFLQAEKANDYQYLQSRGISPKTQHHFHIGFVPDWKHQTKYPENTIPTPRVIIPRSKYSYMARFTGTIEELLKIDSRMENPKLNSKGKVPLFNPEALEQNPVFIVEGEIDAMSIYEAGGAACGLCSASNRRLLLNRLKDSSRVGQAFILMLDNDEAGKYGQAELEKDLQKLGIAYITAEYPTGIKDPNQYLQEDPEGLKRLVSSLQVQALEIATATKGNKYCACDLLNYFKTIERQPLGFEAKTGFDDLDIHLGGGLHEGLYVLGAISSLGKTTFALQLADQIAMGGQEIIFFSLEMSKYELIAKSISRHSYQISRVTRKKDDKVYLAKNTKQILNNRYYISYGEDEKQIIKRAIDEYEKSASRIFIYEGRYKGERLTVEHIREIVKQHIKNTGQKPVVFVDYLQIIANKNTYATDKQNTDVNIFELKEISRDYKIPVFVISSFNRDNYNEPVSMQSFKESGAIEYSSDVLLGLQYSGMDYRDGENTTARNKRLRELAKDIFRKKSDRERISVDLKCLKHRNGCQFTLSFYMMPAYNYFESASKVNFDKPKKIPQNKKKVL